MMVDKMVLKDVFDKHDDEELKEIISRMATRLVTHGGLDVNLANAGALMMLADYIAGLFKFVCEKNDLEPSVVQNDLGENVIQVNMLQRTRH